MSTGDEALHAHLAAEYAKARHWPERKKARLWDELAAAIEKPGLRDTEVWQISAMRRAVKLLLAYPEELPAALAAELGAYLVTLDALHLEAIDGFADVDGVLNLLPAHIILTLMNGISREHETE